MVAPTTAVKHTHTILYVYVLPIAMGSVSYLADYMYVPVPCTRTSIFLLFFFLLLNKKWTFFKNLLYEWVNVENELILFIVVCLQLRPQKATKSLKLFKWNCNTSSYQKLYEFTIHRHGWKKISWKFLFASSDFHSRLTSIQSKYYVSINCNYTTNSWCYCQPEKSETKRNETKRNIYTKYVNSHPKKRFLAILHNNLCIFCTVDSLCSPPLTPPSPRTHSLAFPLSPISIYILHSIFKCLSFHLHNCLLVLHFQRAPRITKTKKRRRKWIARALV